MTDPRLVFCRSERNGEKEENMAVPPPAVASSNWDPNTRRAAEGHRCVGSVVPLQGKSRQGAAQRPHPALRRAEPPGHRLHDLELCGRPLKWRKSMLIENPKDRRWQMYREFQGAKTLPSRARYFEQLVVVPGLQMVTLFLRTPGTPRPPV